MRINKKVFLLGISIICTLSACSPISDKQLNENEADGEISSKQASEAITEKGNEGVSIEGYKAIVSEEYADALTGEKVIQTPDGTMSVNEFEDLDYLLYCFSDVDGDGSDELVFHGRIYFYVVKKTGDEYKVIYDGCSYDKPIDLENCHGIMYYRNEGAPFHEMYKFHTISSDIEGTEVIYASWYDEDEDGEMEDTDWFFLDSYEENKVSKDEWLKAIQDYFPLKDVEIEWKKFVE